MPKSESRQIHDSSQQQPRPSDSVRLERALEEQKMLQRQRAIEADILGRCRAWLAALPPGTVLEQIVPRVEDGLPLRDVRTRIKKMQDTVTALKRVPIPPSNIQLKVQTYVQGLTRPIVGGIGVDEHSPSNGQRNPTYYWPFFSRRPWLKGCGQRSIGSRIRRVRWPSASGRSPSLKVK